MNWIILIIAGLFEVIWAIGLKYTNGFTKLIPSIITIIAMLLSVVLLGIAMKHIPASVAYSVWVGVGIVGTFICGIFVLGESFNILKLISVTLIILGIIGLKIS